MNTLIPWEYNMNSDFNNQTNPPGKQEFKFSIDRDYYAISGTVSGLFIVIAAALYLLDITGILLPFAGIFLVWGVSNIMVYIKSPVFQLTGDAFIVSYANSSESLRIPLASLHTISSILLINPRMCRRTILVANEMHRISIPPRLNIDNRELLGILVERTTAVMEGRQSVSDPPPAQLKEIADKFQHQDAGKKVSVFKGPVKKISIYARLFRKTCIMLYFMIIGIFIVSVNQKDFFPSVIVTSIFLAIFILLSFLSSRPRQKEWFLVSPTGIAMFGKHMKGELFWHEAKTISYRRSRSSLFTSTGGHRSPTGQFLFISTRESVSIPIPDIYNVPLPCIERMMILYSRESGTYIKIPDFTHTRTGAGTG